MTRRDARPVALLTAREVADLLGFTTETILRWTRRGELPAIRLPGGAVRFRAAEVNGWLEERATGAPARVAALRPRNLESTPPEDEED